VFRAGVVAVVCALAGATPAMAADSTCQLDAGPPPPSPRVIVAEFEGVPYDVLLPADYSATTRRYPVLYLFHGRQYSEHSWLVKSDLQQFTAGFTGDRAAIVVTPTAGSDAYFYDYYDNSQDWEKYIVGRLIPHIDATLRTIPDGAHRAIAGFSAGGLGASYLGSRHPDLFAAVGAFSGVVDQGVPEAPYAGPGDVPVKSDAGSPGPARGPLPTTYHPPKSSCGGGSSTGDPVDQRWNWHEHSPPSLAENLRGDGVYTGAGNGQPCGPDDANDPVLLAPGEPALLTMAQTFDRALTDAKVAHVFDPRPCGLHNMVNATRQMHPFWDLMAKSFGRPDPASFDFRSTDADIDVWGWSFRADPKRAPEFLEVQGASASGVTLIGSGTTTVVTKRLFGPHERVDVSGAKPQSDTADADGRLTMAVDLGPPAATPQFGTDARAFTARRIRFTVPGAAAQLPPDRTCSGRRLAVKLRHLTHGEARRSVAISVDGHRVLVRRGLRAQRLGRVDVTLPPGATRVGVRIRTTRNRTLKSTRVYPACP
jgi:S-formylglutathione hydrolase FrmB